MTRVWIQGLFEKQDPSAAPRPPVAPFVLETVDEAASDVDSDAGDGAAAQI